ncbi:protein POLR1D [Echeneis naucrates]|uniref:Uncharacterized protein n=1 Tax=Echeneis naucrates TaxID=173247 RepID=A0A665UVQ3_ECHNA|nr:protein POLR1D [Echeneis naucrates]
MAEDNELEKRAVEELLRETDRARVRAETMGPAGWLKCPLRGTNKRFLLNTLRSTGLQRPTSDPRAGHTATGGHRSSKSPDRARSRSRSPPKDHRKHGGRTDRKNHHTHSWNKKDKKEDRNKERSYRNRDRRRAEDVHKRQ